MCMEEKKNQTRVKRLLCSQSCAQAAVTGEPPMTKSD